MYLMHYTLIVKLPLTQIPESLCITACGICVWACGYNDISKTFDTACNTVYEECNNQNDLECRELNDAYNWNELESMEWSME